jgi:hypothetical protein
MSQAFAEPANRALTHVNALRGERQKMAWPSRIAGAVTKNDGTFAGGADLAE